MLLSLGMWSFVGGMKRFIFLYFLRKVCKKYKKRQGEEKRADGTVWDIIYDKERLEEG